jgi:hypothetical protein
MDEYNHIFHSVDDITNALTCQTNFEFWLTSFRCNQFFVSHGRMNRFNQKVIQFNIKVINTFKNRVKKRENVDGYG